MERAAAAVAIEHRGCNVQSRSQENPDLPVREHAPYRELLRRAYIGSQAPESQHVCHQRSGDQQCATGQRHMAILSCFLSRSPALAKADANDHVMNRPRL